MTGPLRREQARHERAQSVDEPPEVSAEMIRINTEARHLALQIALLIPILAGVAGILNGFRMRRLPDPKPSEAAEGSMLG